MQHLSLKWQAIHNIKGRLIALGHLPSQILTPMDSLVANRKFTMKHIPPILLEILLSYLRDKNRFYRTQGREKQIWRWVVMIVV
jgi:hypothetical protein